MTTTRLDIHEAEATLSKHIARLKPGDRIVLLHGNRPVAEIRPIEEPTDAPRPVGLGKGLVDIPASFFDPLPDELLNQFEGRSG